MEFSRTIVNVGDDESGLEGLKREISRGVYNDLCLEGGHNLKPSVFAQ
jgi:hypothetical protein